MMFGSSPDPGESTPDPRDPDHWIPPDPFAIDLIGGPRDGGVHWLEPGWSVPDNIGVVSKDGTFCHWYVVSPCWRSAESPKRGRAVFSAELTRRMAE